MRALIKINDAEYTAQYDDAHSALFGFDSAAEFYSVYCANERAIERAVARAVEADYGTGINSHITVTLFPTN